MSVLFALALGSSWLDHVLTGGRGNMHLYHVVLFYFAAIIVYPDRIVAAISQRLRKPIGWRTTASSELGYLAMMAFLTLHFMVIDSGFSAWESAFLISFWLVLRAVYWLIGRGFE